MDELKKFFKDIGRIADAMEKIVADNSEANVFINSTLKEVKTTIDNNVKQDVTTNQIVQPVQPSVDASIRTAIPVTNTAQSYTQEQLAVAMGRALDMGKMTEIQNLLAQFSVNSLMELTPDKYNDLALKLREIGVEV